MSIDLSQTHATGAGADGLVDLTSEGGVDWIQWDGVNASNFSRKAGGSAISTWSAVGTFTASLFGDSGYRYTWSDGTPVGVGTNLNGISASAANGLGDNEGWRFSVTVPAAGHYLLKVYGHSDGSGRFDLSAGIGDALQAVTGVLTSGLRHADFTVHFTADAAGQVLTAEYLRKNTGGAPVITLDAVGLQATPNPPHSVKVFLLAGQSNMLGLGANNDLPTVAPELEATTPGAIIWENAGGNNALTNPGWESMGPGRGLSANEFGPELKLARQLRALYPDHDLALVKHAVSATSLAVDWDPPTGAKYTAWLASLGYATQSLHNAGLEYEIEGMFWTQGERDTRDNAHATAYQSNLTNLISEVRQTVGITNMPFILSRLSSRQTDLPATELELVRAAQTDAANAMTHVWMVDTDDMAFKSDDLHFNTEGQVALGGAFGETWEAAILGIELRSGLVGQYTFDGTLGDTSAYGNDADVNSGSAAYVDGKFSRAVDLPGSTQFVAVPRAAQNEFGTSDFSICLWVNRDVDGTVEGLLDNCLGTGGGMLIVVSPLALGAGNNGVRVGLYENGGTGAVEVDSTGTDLLTAGAGWQHLAVTVDRDQTDGLKIYIDGELDSSHDPTSLNGKSITGTTLNWAIGVLNANTYFDGKLDDLRFYNHALSAAEVQDLTTINGALVGHYTFNTTLSDSSVYVNHASLFGTAGVSYGSGRYGNAIDLDGVDQFVEVSLATPNELYLSDFSICMWVNRDRDGTPEGLVDNCSGTSGGMLIILSPVSLGTGNDRVRVALYENGGTSDVIAHSSESGLLTADAGWQHLAITVDRDQGDGLKIYINGELDSSHDPRALDGKSITGTEANWAIGVLNGSAFFDGQIDDLRLYNTALSAADIAQMATVKREGTVIILRGGRSTVPSPPSAPSDMTAVANNSNVTLQWNDNREDDLLGYKVYRKVGNRPFACIATLPASTSGYVDYGFGTSEDHTYRVTALDTSQRESLPAECVVTAKTPPGTLDFSPVSETNRPNIILVMADDQGWGDTGYNGHPVLLTPTLDDMAANGFVFNRFYAAAPVCSPTRASVMSGRHPIRSKTTNHGRYMRSHLEQTLPRALKSAGYVTGMFGKSHLGSGQPDSPVNPTGMGFDEWVIGLNFFDNSPFLSRNGTVEQRIGEQGSVVVMDETLAFLDRHRGGNKPMFAVTWFPSPHSPHDERCSDPSLYSGDSSQAYYQEISLLDEQLGRLRQWLRDQDLYRETLIWYCSDNGGLLTASSGGRDKKGSTWEGGLRVPGIIEWPERNLRGASNVPVVTSDMYPTLLALLNITVDNQYPLDGIDIRGVIEGTMTSRPGIGFWHAIQDGEATWSDDILSAIMIKQQNGDPLPHNAYRIKKDVDEFPQFDESLATGNAAWLEWPWKLHRGDNGSLYELYNLETDPLEQHNLVADTTEAERVAAMTASLLAWQTNTIRSLNGADYGLAPAGSQ